MVLALTVTLVACGGSRMEADPAPAGEPALDLRSWHLGAIACFAEMAAVGVKKLGLSAAMSPEEMDLLFEEAERTADRNGADIWRERDFLVTDLFSESLTEGKHVLLLYTGDTLQEYLDLKAEKARLQQQNAYAGEARREIARRMGRLLSYPEETIERLLSESDSYLR